MTSMGFDPGKVLGDEILNMSKQELCQLVIKLCRLIKAEAGSKTFRGGVYPENISIDSQGNVSLGLAKQEDWQGQELQFIAPELCWNGQRSPASDVYSLGLLLYYGINDGKLPFEDQGGDGRMRRMGGEQVQVPKKAGRRLAEIISKALSFKAEDRYQSVEELEIMLQSCISNSYGQADGAQGIFKKDNAELSDMERLMLNIIQGDDQTESAQTEPVEEPQPADPVIEDFAQMMNSQPKAQPEQPETVEEPQDAEEPEELKVYEPVKPVKPAKRQPVPVLTEEKNPTLEPVVVRRQSAPAVQYGRQQPPAASRDEVKRKVFLTVLILCAMIIVTAILVNAMLKDFAWQDAEQTQQPTNNQIDNVLDTPAPDGSAGAGLVTVPTAPPSDTEETEGETETQTSYQIIKEDISWTDAQSKCQQMGGTLAVIHNQDELAAVIALAEEAGVNRLWIGCHRVNGTLTWEDGSDVMFYPWAEGEPSYEDAYDGTAENYILLWNNNGQWSYNDSRNDPVSDYPDWYKGTIGFVCQFN